MSDADLAILRPHVRQQRRIGHRIPDLIAASVRHGQSVRLDTALYMRPPRGIVWVGGLDMAAIDALVATLPPTSALRMRISCIHSPGRFALAAYHADDARARAACAAALPSWAVFTQLPGWRLFSSEEVRGVALALRSAGESDTRRHSVALIERTVAQMASDDVLLIRWSAHGTAATLSQPAAPEAPWVSPLIQWLFFAAFISAASIGTLLFAALMGGQTPDPTTIAALIIASAIISALVMLALLLRTRSR